MKPKPAEHPSAREILAVVCSLPADDSDIYLPADVATGPDGWPFTYGSLRALQLQIERFERYHADELARERREFCRAYVLATALEVEIDDAVSAAKRAWDALQKEGL